jgi:hypothetical protein
MIIAGELKYSGMYFVLAVWCDDYVACCKLHLLAQNY